MEDSLTIEKSASASNLNPLMALAELTGTLTSMLDPTAVLQATIAELAKVLPYYGAIIWMLDSEKEELYVASSAGISPNDEATRVKLGIGLLGVVMTTGEAINVPDTQKDQRFFQQITSSLTRSLMLAPIIVDGKPGGILTLGSLQPDTYSSDDFQLLVACANATSIALKNAQLYAAQREEMEIRDSLLRVAEEIRSLSSLDNLLRRIAEITPSLVSVDQCLIFLVDPKRQEVNLAQTYGLGDEAKAKLAMASFDSHQVSVLVDLIQERRVPQLCDLDENCPLFSANITNVFTSSTIICMPLIAKEEPLGLMILGNSNANLHFGDREKAVLTGIANQVSVAIENTILYQEATERRKEAQETAAQLRAILHSMAEGVIVYDKDLRVQITNPAVARVFRAESYEARNKEMAQMLSNVNSRIVEYAKALEHLEIIRQAPEKSYEMEWVLKDPSMVLKRVWSPVYNNRGEFIGGVAVFHNITAEREAQSARDEFISLVSHEVRNPLSLIKGLAQTILRRRKKEAPTREHEELGVIVEQADRIARLVNDLLDVSRIERRVLSLEHEPIYLPALISNIVEKLSPSLHRHKLSLEVPRQFPTGYWDTDRLVQVFTNLIDNAVKYTPAGGQITITCSTKDKNAVFCVTDNGVGIAEENLHRVFDRFFRIPTQNRTGQDNSMGLGLYVSKGIIKAHGGKIWVESRINEGSKFCCSLPLGSKEQQTTNSPNENTA